MDCWGLNQRVLCCQLGVATYPDALTPASWRCAADVPKKTICTLPLGQNEVNTFANAVRKHYWCDMDLCIFRLLFAQPHTWAVAMSSLPQHCH